MLEALAPPKEGCARCGGRGWVVELDGGAGTARPCECRREDVGPRLLDASGIPPRYRACTLANFKPFGDPRLQEALAVCRRYVDGFLSLEGRFRQGGLLFMGPPGSGKTHLAAALLTELVERYRVRGRFVDFNGLIHQIQSTFDPSSPESKHDVLDPVIGAEVLVLDELGAQKPTAWVQDVLYLVMNTRYTRQLPTIFTTNYRLESTSRERAATAAGEAELLASRIPAMLVSRLYEMAQPVLLECADYRREVKAKRSGV